MDTGSFVVHIKADIHEDIAEDVEKRFDRKIMTKFAKLRARNYSYLIDDHSDH